MKLEIEYIQLANSINVLDKLKLKGLPSIHRTRLSKQLGGILERVGQEQLELQKEYFETNDNDEPIMKDDKCKDKEGYEKAIDTFIKERAVIDSGDSQVALKSVKNALETSEVEFDGRDAYSFEYLYSALSDDTEDAPAEEVEG